MRGNQSLAALTLLVVAACSRAPVAEVAKAPKQAYLCGDLAVTAEFTSPESVTISFSGTTLLLARVPAASGARYADVAGNEFWTKDGALLTLTGQPLRRCTLT